MRKLILLLYEWNGIFTFPANLCSETHEIEKKQQQQQKKNTEKRFQIVSNEM